MRHEIDRDVGAVGLLLGLDLEERDLAVIVER